MSVQMTSETARSIKNVEQFSDELKRYTNAAVGIILVRTREPTRCAEVIQGIAIEREARYRLWACNKGWQTYAMVDREDDQVIDTSAPINSDLTTVDPSKAFEKIFEEHGNRMRQGISPTNPEVFVMYYPHHHFDKPIIHQWIKDFAQLSREVDNRLILLCPDTITVPAEIEDDIYIMDFAAPSFAELRQCYDDFVEGIEDKVRPDLDEDDISSIVQNGLGMTYSEFETAIALAVVTYQKPDQQSTASVNDYVQTMLKHKIEIVKKTDILELMPAESMSDVGGFDIMKEWLDLRSKAYSQKARNYGIKVPKGLLCVGPPGTGKSLFAKATANRFNVPLVKFDIGKVFGKFVGQSEGRIRMATKIVEAMAPCVLLVDEIDKGLGGLSGGGSDGGTSMRVLGSFLNWMQDRDTDRYPVFIVMTANNVTGLPPELMRRGRIDEIFACTFPGHGERMEIASIHLTKRGHKLSKSELEKIAAASDKYVGAELESAIEGALLTAFSKDMPHPTADIVVEHLKGIVPLSKAFADKMNHMHEWAKNNAKPASSSMNFDDLASPKPVGGVRKINVPKSGPVKSRGLDG